MTRDESVILVLQEVADDIHDKDSARYSIFSGGMVTSGTINELSVVLRSEAEHETKRQEVAAQSQSGTIECPGLF